MPTESQEALTIDNVTASSGNASWSPTTNSLIRNSDNNYTEVDLVTIGSADTSDYLQMGYDNFDNISSTDQIDSLQVSIEGHYESLQHQASMRLTVSSNNGSSFCSGHSLIVFPVNTDATRTITCSHHSWTYSNIDDIVTQFQVQGADENVTYYVDYSYLTATYSEVAPNVPTNLSASLNPYNNVITASWTASTGTTVSNYTVDYNGTTTTTSSTSININVTDPDPNTAYAVKVRANGVDNSSAYTSTVTTVYTFTQDIENADFTVTPLREDGFVLNWKNLLNGVTNWKVEQYNGSSWTTLTTASATTFTYKVTGLDNTIEYKFRLSASNGDSVYSAQFKEVS
jgi:hypothetical protein